jgi:hypothetical protein
VDLERARDTIATEAPRRLRLAELLSALGAREPGPPAHLADGSGTLAPVVDAAGARSERLTVGELVDRAAEGGFGFLVGVLALLAIPFVGLSTPFGLAIALIGGQMMLGLTKPWLPARMRRRPLAMTMFDRVLALLARRTRWLARMTKRRLELAIRPRVIGLMIFVLALGLALPLPIPGSNLVFLIPLFIYAIGILERDGAWIIVGHVCTAIDVALLFVFGRTVWYVVTHLV